MELENARPIAFHLKLEDLMAPANASLEQRIMKENAWLYAQLGRIE